MHIFVLLCPLIQACPDDRTHDDHRMEPYQPSFEESSYRHPVPPVVVGISYYESGEDEEKVHGEISVIDNLLCRSRGICLKKMEKNHQHRCHPAQPVENLVAGL